ncbi:hypothetical protein [Micromonospora cathayae]|uniref:Uncharacterized protein n=1 Tax=Micromonospora cathayae TaxID=3028804 RepID=A0ABY7ZVG7_9ACTN|nr:hypothetical protein [Micromonospora sp. HUAS 3]WDZ86863.1 hypothetical protein PVK37_10920 [Micromonospora sp. HUAS 3]
MNNLPNPLHPSWCLRGPNCAGAGDLHQSRLIPAAARGDELFQVRVGLWRMDVGPTPPSGLLLELSAGAESDCWPIDLAQSRALVHLSGRLVRRLAPTPARHVAA